MPSIPPSIERKFLPALPANSDLWVPEGSSVELIQAMFANSTAFVSLCHIQTMDSTPSAMGPHITPMQRRVAEEYDARQYLWINKYRQAMISTLMVMLLLRDCMLLPGMRGAIVAQKEDLHKDLMRRVVLAYENLPKHLRVPVKDGTRPTATGIEFEHGGYIIPITAGSDSPGVGSSPDRAIVSEACEMDDEAFARLTQKFFPAVTSKTNGKLVMESTPGRAGTPMHRLWRMSLERRSRFHPIHLRWYQDPRRHSTDPGIVLDDTDFAYRERVRLTPEQMPDAALRFRRLVLPEFDNSDDDFENKYPPDARAGWVTKQAQVFDRGPLNKLKETAVADPPVDPEAKCRIIKPYIPGRTYLITADPANFGATGDDSALTVWDTSTWEEVAFWEGREQPDAFYRRLVAVALAYGHEDQLLDDTTNGVYVAIESNAGAVLGAAVLENRLLLYRDEDDKPGWAATTKSIQEAEADTNTMLGDGSIKIHTLSLIDQLIMFDGKKRDRRLVRADGTQSHYDRARTAIMACHILRRRQFRPPLTSEEVARVEARKARKEADAKFRKMMKLATGGEPGVIGLDPLETWAPPAYVHAY
jgi:hypothetical protein